MSKEKRKSFMIHKDIRVNDWIEIKYQGFTYYGSMKTLLKTWFDSRACSDAEVAIRSKKLDIGGH